MSVTVSGEVPAQDVHDTVPDMAFDPADAADQVTDGRVVTDDTEAVPDAPGSPVCSCTNEPAAPVNVVPEMTFSQAFAVFTADRPRVANINTHNMSDMVARIV